MPNFQFDKTKSDEESRAVKLEVKKFYRWKYGYAPPAEWQMDHQVEQMVQLYERFGSPRIHSLPNVLLVPPELNTAKNIAYNQSWVNCPVGFRHVLNPADDARRFGDKNPQRIRELIHRRSLFMKDPDEAWAFLTEFSKQVLIELIEKLSITVWAKTPPNWLKISDHWLPRLKDDVLFHNVYIAQYLRAKAKREAEASDVRVLPSTADVT